MVKFSFVEIESGFYPVACVGDDPGTRNVRVLEAVTSSNMDRLRRTTPTMPVETRRELLRQWAAQQETTYHGGPSYGIAGYNRAKERPTWTYSNGLPSDSIYLLKEEKGVLTVFIQGEHGLKPVMDETFNVPDHFEYVISSLQAAGRRLKEVDGEIRLDQWHARPNRGGQWFILCGGVEEVDREYEAWQDKGCNCWSRRTKVRFKPKTVVSYEEYGIGGWVNGDVWGPSPGVFYVKH